MAPLARPRAVGFIVPLRMTDRELEGGDEIVHRELAIDMDPYEPVPVETNGHTPSRVPVGWVLEKGEEPNAGAVGLRQRSQPVHPDAELAPVRARLQ
jgi:hypothetical protein